MASPKGDPFCRPKSDAIWPRKGLRHFVLGLATKHRKMVEKIIVHLLINLGFLTQNEICLADVLILGQTLTSGHLFYFLSYPAIYLETWHAVKFRNISPGVCIFQRPFLRGLFLEKLRFGTTATTPLFALYLINYIHTWKRKYIYIFSIY